MSAAPSHLASHLLTALGLAMDCAAVAAAYGLSRHAGSRLGLLARLALSFGAFQPLLFLLGWALGAGFRVLLAPWDHWIAFVLLAGIGLKMIRESFQEGEAEGPPPLDLARLLVLSLATSVDALAVGVGFSLTGEAVAAPAALIGVASALLAAAGFLGAARLGARLGPWAERLGGVVLVLLGARILIEHLRAGI